KEIKSINVNDKEKLTPYILNMLLTANIPRNITQSISNESNKEPMSDEEVGDCIAKIFTFILYCVRNHLEVEQHILDEIEEVFGHGADFKITFEDLNKLVYIEAVIKE
ncbi:40579_t:CDS:2, partial [Gigaspora margarita]